MISRILLLLLCSAVQLVAQPDFTGFVNPFVGTGGHGHTFPGATVPFGMVQLSPDTRVDGSWDGCGGYHHSDSTIYGFSHTHLSGTGVSDYGDVLMMPTGGPSSRLPSFNPYAYRSRYSHSTEVAEAGYYSVYLPVYEVKVELTATERMGVPMFSRRWQVTKIKDRASFGTLPGSVEALECWIIHCRASTTVFPETKIESSGMFSARKSEAEKSVGAKCQFAKRLSMVRLSSSGKGE